MNERYFTDFGNAWLNMVNSIQWQEATSLSEAIAQLSLIGDVRLRLWPDEYAGLAGKTGEKGEALADSIVDSAKNCWSENIPDSSLEQAQGRKVHLMESLDH
jgi:type VI secretion system protein ImpL